MNCDKCNHSMVSTSAGFYCEKCGYPDERPGGSNELIHRILALLSEHWELVESGCLTLRSGGGYEISLTTKPAPPARTE